MFNGNLEKDTEVMLKFFNKNIKSIVIFGFSGLFGIHGDRLGLVSILNKESDVLNLNRLTAHLTRSIHSFSPRHSSDISNLLLQKKEYFDEHLQHIQQITDLYTINRLKLHKHLMEKDSYWNFVKY